MRDIPTPRVATAVQRLSVVVDSELLEALQGHQRKVECDTRMRVSLSQVAGGLMRRGLDRSSADR